MDKPPFATPAIWVAGMSADDWHYEVHEMLKRAHLTQQFLNGWISAENFMDGLHDCRVDVISAASDWVDGISYL